jgi:hypothetical protein
MATTNNPQVQDNSSQAISWKPLESPLESWIKQWEKEGVTLELIIALIMSNPQGSGAMDVVSNSIAGITQQSNILSAVQSDVITLNAILSKIESQLGTKVSPTDLGKFPPELLKQFQSTYKKLFVSNTSNPNHESDLALLKSYEKKFPTLEPVVSGVEGWKDDFSTALNKSSNTFDFDIQHWDGKTVDPDKDSSGFIKDILYVAGQHYQANHPNTDGSKSVATDYLQNWWTEGNADQQLLSGQSQQDTTQIQSYMQLLQGFDSSAQQDIRSAADQKAAMIRNEKAS